MIFMNTLRIAAAFENHHNTFRIYDCDTYSVVEVGYIGDYCNTTARIFSSDVPDNYTFICTPALFVCSEKAGGKGLQVINEMNRKVHFARFILDEEEDQPVIRAEFELIDIPNDLFGETVFRAVLRFFSAVDQAYPEMATALGKESSVCDVAVVADEEE